MARRVARRFVTGGSLIAAAVLAAQGTAFAVGNLPPEQPSAADLFTGGKPCVSGTGEVRAYDRAVVTEELAALAKRQAVRRGRWALETAVGGLSPASQGTEPLQLNGGATIYHSDYDALAGTGHLDLDGSTGFAATNGPVVDSADSFSIGVVVRLADEQPDHPMTVLSQGGGNNDAFKVRYVPSTSTWELVMSDADEPGAAETVVSRIVSPDGGAFRLCS